MDRAEWLQKWQDMAEKLYDHCAPATWVKFSENIDKTHRQFMEKFLGQLEPHSTILDAACGSGRFDGMLLEAGHDVLGIDQSAGMLAAARQHYPLERFPQLRYEKIALQEMKFQQAFDGIICMDAMEHIFPEDWPGIVRGFQKALKPGGVLYITVDGLKLPGDAEAYEHAKAMGLPVVFGEIVDELDEVYNLAMGMDSLETPSIGYRLDLSVYHYHPTLEHVRKWYQAVGLSIEEVGEEKEGEGEGYVHVLATKKV